MKGTVHRAAASMLVAAAAVVALCVDDAAAQRPTPTPFPRWLSNDTALSCAPAKRFYDQCVNMLSVFGQRGIGDSSVGQPSGNSQVHAPGVVVDRSTCNGVACPNKVYVVDNGNNRILGYRSLGHCVVGDTVGAACTNERDCPRGSTCRIEPQTMAAAIVLGQDDFTGSSCNRDSNVGMNGPAGDDTLCFAEQPGGANRAEFWRRITIDVDNSGNVYVPDVQNNRVLKFNEPLSSFTAGGRGDNVADYVWGQPDMQSNTPGSSLRSLHLTSVDEPTVILGWGVSADNNGGVWVADTLNRRVLHFSSRSTQADVVVGRGTGPCSRSVYELCYPVLARQDGDSLWVLDQNGADGLPFSSRLVRFTWSGSSWRGTAVRAPLSGYRREPGGPEIFQATGFVFKPRLSGVIDPYPSGYIWINEHEANRALLIDAAGTIITAVGGSEDPPGSRKYRPGCSGADAESCGQSWGLDPRLTGKPSDYRLCSPGGSIGFDNDNNIYLADGEFWRVSRYKLPFVTAPNPSPQHTPGRCLPDPNGGLSGRNFPSDIQTGHSVGLTVFDPVPPTPDPTPQLIVRGDGAYVAWNDHTRRGNGPAADVVLDYALGTSKAFDAVDDRNRLWTTRQGKLVVFPLPLSGTSTPIRPDCADCAVEPGSELLTLQWADDGATIDYFVEEWNGVAFDDSDPARKAIWLAMDNRIFRIGNYDEVGTEPLRVDMVVGQIDKTAIYCNRNALSAESKRVDGIQRKTTPGPNTLCQPTNIVFDAHGNLFVVEGSYECVWSGNNRVSVFMADDTRGAVSAGGLFPDLAAEKVFVASSLTDGDRRCTNQPQAPGAPVSLAFDSHNHMVLGNDGTSAGTKRDRYLKQLWFYKDPLAKWVSHPTTPALNGQFVQQQMPDAVLRLPMGVVGQMQFDASDNLLIQDHTWHKAWLLNLDAEIDASTGWSKWLVPTSWDADHDGIVNLLDPFPYGSPPTPTATRTAARRPTATPTACSTCVGDCNGDGRVSVNEIVVGDRIAFGFRPPSDCRAVDADDSGTVRVNEIIAAVDQSLNGCGCLFAGRGLRPPARDGSP